MLREASTFVDGASAPNPPANLAAAAIANPHGAESFQTSFGTKCTTCHKVVHGSDHPSQPLTGGGLTR